MTNEEIFKANTKLAYSIANKYLINYQAEYEDIKQVALMGLWKAVKTLKNDKTFSTYAYAVISNEINQYLRKVKKHKSIASLNAEIKENITIEDAIADERDYIDEIHTKIENNQLKQILFENLYNFKPKQREVCMLMLKEKKQKEIADEIGISQTQVSRIEKKIKTKLLKIARIEECL